MSCIIGFWLPAAGCREIALPDGQGELTKLMESADLEVALQATQRLDRLHGSGPLLQAVRSGGTQARWLAAAALQAHPSAEARDVLLSALRDPSAQVRSKAVISLRSMCDQNCVPLIEPLLNDSDETVRIVAGATLREIGQQ